MRERVWAGRGDLVVPGGREYNRRYSAASRCENSCQGWPMRRASLRPFEVKNANALLAGEGGIKVLAPCTPHRSVTRVGRWRFRARRNPRQLEKGVAEAPRRWKRRGSQAMIYSFIYFISDGFVYLAFTCTQFHQQP